MMHSRWLLKLRGALRSLGVLTAIRAVTSWPDRRRHAARRAEFEKTKPDAIDLPGTPVPVKFHPIDAGHYADLMTPREPAVMRAIADLATPGTTVWEVGSNVGYFTTIMGKLVGPQGRVFAFEPDPGSHAQLLTNAKLNGLDTIRPFTFALGDADGEFRLRSNPNPASGVHRIEAGENGIPVRVRVGDEVRTRESLPVPNLLKVDVEGAEYRVLKGLRETLAHPDCRAVVVEVHFAILANAGEPDTPIAICDYLKDRGFTKLTWADASHLVATK
jgi:FkbM family methyltransferase